MVESEKARQWLQRLEAWKASGLSRRAWCEREGVNRNTLDYWRRRLHGAVEPPGLAPIVMAPGPEARAIVEDPERVSIELPRGVRVRCAAGTDAVWLSALVRGMAGC